MPFAFAPFRIYPLAIVCPAFLLTLWLNCTASRAFWRGFLFGLGLFGIGTSWVYVSIHTYGNTIAILAGLLTGLFVSTLALFPATQGYIFTRFFSSNNLSKLCLAFPSSWVLFEWFRSWFLTGFPWLFLGASQTDSPLRGFASVIGEYGISFAVVLSSALLVIIAQNSKLLILHLTRTCPKIKLLPTIYLIKIVFLSIFVFISIWFAGAILAQIKWTHPQGQPFKVSLIQGDIPQQLKWDPAYLETTLKRYYTLTQPHWDSQLIIWPEAAIPLLLHDAKPFLNLLDNQAKQHHTTFITGIPVQEGFSYYNAMILLGKDQGIYYKRHLVPFGEYVPLDYWLRGLIGFFNIPMSDFSRGPAQQKPLRATNLIIAPFICYEIAYPELVHSELPQANLLVTISNDAWFGHSFAAAQQLQIGQIRALETSRYALFATNNGITAIITPQGSIQAMAKPYQPTVLTDTVEAMTGSTPFIELGVIPVIVLISALLLIAWWWK